MKVVIIMGSKSDLVWSKKIAETLSKLGIESTLRIASAHKVPLKVLEIIKEYEHEDVVFVTVAGRSNALSGFIDAHTVKPVIACPTDGLRIYFESGEIVHLRPSGNAPEFRCYTEADTESRAVEMNRICMDIMTRWR